MSTVAGKGIEGGSRTKHNSRETAVRKLRRKPSILSPRTAAGGRWKRQRIARAADENSPPLESSDCGLDEVELTQSDEVMSAQSSGTDGRNSEHNSTPRGGAVGDNTDSLPAPRENNIPLSHRRLQRRRSTLPSGNSSRPNISDHDAVRTEDQITNGNLSTPPSLTPHPPDVLNISPPDDLRSAHNTMKAEVVELKRDKRAYSSALITLQDKSEQMRKDLQMKNQQITALEEALSRKRSNSSGRKMPWSLDSLSKCGLARYQGICFSAGKYGTKLAKLLITESYIDETNEGYQKQDWTPSATKVSNETANKSIVSVKLPDGVFAIPICSMVRAMKLEFFTSRFKGSVGLLKASFFNVLEGPVGSYLTEAERNECLSQVSSHRPTVQKFRAIISDAVGNRKKTARNTYLKALGYKHASMPDCKKNTAVIKDLRNREKESILRRCLNEENENDTTYWRTSGWESLCLGSLSDEVGDEMNAAEKEIEEQGKVDNLFMNEAARMAFLVLRGYSISNSIDAYSSDSSILYLARADASMTTMLKFINVQGKGGSRNDSFVESFKDLLPKALAVVIKDIWSDLQLSAPHELKLVIGSSSEDDTDPYGNMLRDWTVVQKNPDDNHIYLLASPKYFREKVCSWYGTVKDCHIGRYESVQKTFVMITSSLNCHELEDSDLEEQEIE